MTESNQPQDGDKRLRGDAAWKAEKERIAARNQQASKIGKEQRRAQEARREAERRSC